MTNIIFKRKSKSVPHLRKKIYSKIGNSYLQEQWKTFLENEQQLSPILHELSKAQFDIRNQDKFKYTARSILMMKREIIKYLQQNQLQKGKNKLKQLYEKVNHNQMKKIGMMIIYLECREYLEKGSGNGKEENIICWLKENMNEHLNGNEISLIKIKILTILSILLLRFHGILMSTQEKLIIFKTIQLKKKKMLQMDVRQERQAEFECLLYLLLQLYKILYLLKKDQQTIHFYYNQLHAYTQVYLTRQQYRLYLDVNEINKILTSMKPVLNELDIYEDSKLRKDLAFAHIQEEIIQQENQSSKMLQNKKAQEKVRISSSIKISSHKQVKRTSARNDHKLIINHLTVNTKNSDCFRQQTVEDVLAIEKQPIVFEFLVVSRQRLYVTELQFKFRNGCSLMDLCLTIKNKAFMLQIYMLKGIQVAISRLTFKAISRFLQKTCQILFKSNTYFRQMHNIYFADDYLPKKIDYEHMAVGLARIKTQVGQYIRQNNCHQSILGRKFSIPEVTLQDIKKYFDKQGNIGEAKTQKNMISKRSGFILKQNFKVQKIAQTCIKMLLKKQNEKYHQYFFFNIFFEHCFKGIQIYYINQKEEPVDLTQFINKLKKISSKLSLDKKKIRPLNIIAQILSLQNRIQRIVRTVETYKVEQQLQINQQKLRSEIIKVKSSKHHHKHKEKPKKPKIFEMIKMQKTKFYLFVKQVRSQYMIYKNEKAKLYLPPNWKQLQWALVKNRLRVYAGIKIAHPKQSLNYFVKAYRQDQTLAIKEQLIVLTFQRHKIIRKSCGYSMLLQYKTENSQFLYEIVYNKQQRYYFLSANQIVEWNQCSSFDEFAKRYHFELSQGIRQKISEANWYYLNVIKKKKQAE